MYLYPKKIVFRKGPLWYLKCWKLNLSWFQLGQNCLLPLCLPEQFNRTFRAFKGRQMQWSVSQAIFNVNVDLFIKVKQPQNYIFMTSTTSPIKD